MLLHAYLLILVRVYVSVKVFFGINSFSLYTPLFLFSFNVFNALFILNVFLSFLMNFLQLMSFCQLSGKGNTLLYILLFVLLLFVFYSNKRKCVFVTNLQFFVNWLVFICVQLYIERIFNWFFVPRNSIVICDTNYHADFNLLIIFITRIGIERSEPEI